MNVGIGLPNTIPGADGRLLVEWARRADAGPFSTLAVLDRLAYDSLDPFCALAAAAAVTERVGLATMVAIGPLRNTALLVKQAASVDAVSGGTGRGFGRRGRYAEGYAHGGGPPRAFERAAAGARAAWSDLDRPGRPLLWGQGYFALGEEDAGTAYLRDYYAFTGPFAERIATGNLTSARAIRDFVRGYEETGCDELILFPTVADLDQLDRLAEVLS